MIRLLTIAANESRKLSQFRILPLLDLVAFVGHIVEEGPILKTRRNLPRSPSSPAPAWPSQSPPLCPQRQLALQLLALLPGRHQSQSPLDSSSGSILLRGLVFVDWLPLVFFPFPLLAYCHFFVLYQMTVLSFRCVLSICVQLLRRPLFIYYTTRADAAETLRLSADIRAPRDSSRENVKGQRAGPAEYVTATVLLVPQTPAINPIYRNLIYPPSVEKFVRVPVDM